MASIFLTPSPNDVVMSSVDIHPQPFGHRLSIDMPDSPSTGKYVVDRKNDENIKRTMRERIVKAPGVAVAVKLVEEVGNATTTKVRNDLGNSVCCDKSYVDDEDDMPKVEIQITEDGTIQVISDKETAV